MGKVFVYSPKNGCFEVFEMNYPSIIVWSTPKVSRRPRTYARLGPVVCFSFSFYLFLLGVAIIILPVSSFPPSISESFPLTPLTLVSAAR